MSEMSRSNLKTIVRGAYDIQKLRIQMGNRIVGNFKAKLGQKPGEKEETLDPESKALLESIRQASRRQTDEIALVEDPECDGGSADEVAGETPVDKKIGKLIKSLIVARYQAITEKRKTFPTKAAFVGDPVISDYTELCLVGQYVDLLKHEESHFRRLGQILEEFPIYTAFLKGINGVGPAMAGVIISEIDITRARHPSSLWKYAGLDVAQDGRGRSRRSDHLVERDYVNRDGEQAKRVGITFNPFLKTKLVGVLATSFLRAKDCPYAEVYRNYKNRLEHHEKYRDGQTGPDGKPVKGLKGHRHNMAMRYAVKRFLVDLYSHWRALEGLPVSKEYHEAKLGHVHAA